MNTTLSPAATLLGRAAEAGTSLTQRVAQYIAYRETLNDLSGLSTRELDDLGLTRGELRQVAWNSVVARRS